MSQPRALGIIAPQLSGVYFADLRGIETHATLATVLAAHLKTRI